MPDSRELLARLRKLHPKAIDLSLDRMKLLLARLEHPERRLPPVVHIAGTNGKGSVLAILKAILQAGGKRVHSYTSPALLRFHEAIELAQADGNGPAQPISEAELCRLLEQVLAANNGDALTSFEAETATALLAFAEHPADFVLLETGMGGRLDATNVVDEPALTILTPIDIDHADMLGKTVEAIATEKAGILRRGVHAVIARQHDAAFDAIRKRAAIVGAWLFLFGEDWDVHEQQGRLVYQDDEGLTDLPLPALRGRHQIENAGTAIAAVRLIAPDIDDRAIEKGLLSVRWPGRLMPLGAGKLFDRLNPGTEIWVDGGHNPAAGAVVAQFMAELEERSPKSLHMVFGMLSNKDPLAYLRPFADLAASLVAVPIHGLERAYAQPFRPDILAALARDLEIDATETADLEQAMEMIREQDDGPVRVLICGSLHLAGEALRYHEGIDRPDSGAD